MKLKLKTDLKLHLKWWHCLGTVYVVVRWSLRSMCFGSYGSSLVRFHLVHFHFQFVHFLSLAVYSLCVDSCVLGYLLDSLLVGSRWSWSPYVSPRVFSGSPPRWLGSVYISLYWLCCVVIAWAPACSGIYVVSARMRAIVEITGLEGGQAVCFGQWKWLTMITNVNQWDPIVYRFYVAFNIYI
jgi:hypothetical protein